MDLKSKNIAEILRVKEEQGEYYFVITFVDTKIISIFSLLQLLIDFQQFRSILFTTTSKQITISS